MGKPAARIGDEHSCPMVTPGGTPHIGGLVIGPGCTTVLIEKKPAATVGDICACVGDPDTITGGSSGVFIGGKPAARQGDPCAHGGKIVTGSKTVFIGEVKGRGFMRLPTSRKVPAEFQEPSEEEKIGLINQALKDCVTVLEKKLELMEIDDPKTLLEFERWFGQVDGEAKQTILDRIKSQLTFFENATIKNFSRIAYEIDYRNLFAYVYPTDKSYTIYLGKPFWQAGSIGKDSKYGILIHETSHFKNIGKTKDYEYFETECEDLAKSNPSKALRNADSYAFFIIS